MLLIYVFGKSHTVHVDAEPIGKMLTDIQYICSAKITSLAVQFALVVYSIIKLAINNVL